MSNDVLKGVWETQAKQIRELGKDTNAVAVKYIRIRLRQYSEIPELWVTSSDPWEYVVGCSFADIAQEDGLTRDQAEAVRSLVKQTVGKEYYPER